MVFKVKRLDWVIQAARVNKKRKAVSAGTHQRFAGCRHEVDSRKSTDQA